jgi:hypothetical protein
MKQDANEFVVKAEKYANIIVMNPGDATKLG